MGNNRVTYMMWGVIALLALVIGLAMRFTS